MPYTENDRNGEAASTITARPGVVVEKVACTAGAIINVSFFILVGWEA